MPRGAVVQREIALHSEFEFCQPKDSECIKTYILKLSNFLFEDSSPCHQELKIQLWGGANKSVQYSVLRALIDILKGKLMKSQLIGRVGGKRRRVKMPFNLGLENRIGTLKARKTKKHSKQSQARFRVNLNSHLNL